MIAPNTIAQRARIAGFVASLRVRGRDATTDLFDAQGKPEAVKILVEDAPFLADPAQPAQKETPVYVNIHCLAGAVRNPREVGRITEVGNGKFYVVINYAETAGDAVKWTWKAEAERG